MNKELIKSKTITFISIVAFVIIFKSIFGAENTLIGVTTVTAALMFLSKDLTLSPGKVTIKFILFNLFIGIAAALASSNIWLGLVINFMTMFIISYLLCYNLETPMYIPFSLQYLFLLYTPVDVNLLPKRLLSLIAGAVIIVVVQLIANRNRLATNGNKILVGVCDTILLRIKEIKEDPKKQTKGASIKSSINAFRKMVYDKREFDFYLTEEGRIKLNLSVALENIYTLLNTVKGETNLIFILNKLEKLIIETKSILEDEKGKTYLSNNMEEFLKECEEEDISDLKRLQILDSLVLLRDNIDQLKSLDKSEYNSVNMIGEKPNYFKEPIGKYISREHKSIKYCYAMRVSILIALGAFIVDAFNLTSGKWLVFTLLALTNPLYEVSKAKTSDRIIGTTFGVIIATFLFTIFEDMTIRTLILMGAGYIGSYTNDYKYNMMCVTVSAVGAAAMMGNIGEYAFIRITFVIIGSIIAIFANKYLYPYSLEDSNKELVIEHKAIVVKMLEEIYGLIQGEIQPHSIKNLLIATSLIEEKLKINNQILEQECYTKLVEEQRFLVTNIYELYVWVVREKVNPKFVKYVLEDINNLINYKDEEIEEMIENIKEHIHDAHDLKTRITLSSIAIMLQEFKVIEDLKATV